jgi:Protein of unknown function (DUF4050)
LKNDALRSAKRILLATLRDDWEYPPAEAAVQEKNIPPREPIAYVGREEGQSDIEHDEIGSSRTGSFSVKEKNPYQFENPDAIATSIMERKRKRRRLREEEMKWNEGLRIWSQRRDAWTKAVARRPAQVKKQSHLQDKHTSRGTRDRFASESTDISASAASSDPSVLSSSSINSMDVANDPASQLDDPWLPIFPPIIPADNVVRANIKPSAYSVIYSKVVVQSLTPSIPIPLSHMTNALVEGWKAEGIWPSQTTIAPTAVLHEGKKKTSVLFNVMRMRRLGNQGQNHGRDGAKVEDKVNEKAKKGLGTVKKVQGVGPASGDEFGLDYEDVKGEVETTANIQLNKGLLEAA